MIRAVRKAAGSSNSLAEGGTGLVRGRLAGSGAETVRVRQRGRGAGTGDEGRWELS